MKEIDFLPVWYRSGRRRQITYRTQYAGIGGMFIAMIMWSVIAAHSLSKTASKLAQAEQDSINTENTAQEYNKIKTEVVHLQKKLNNIEAIDSKIDVANVLAEISFLVDRQIALSKVEFIAEKFGSEGKGKPKSRSAVRAVSGNSGNKEELPLGDVRFKVLINGIASDASNVADLICKLEDSPYFCQVIPLYTRNKEMRTTTGTRGEKFQISEFEISCNLANYQQEGLHYAEESQRAKVAGL